MIVFSISLDEDTSQNYNFDTTESEKDSGMYLIFFVFTFLRGCNSAYLYNFCLFVHNMGRK